MKFILHLSTRLFLWSIIFGCVIGVFGINLAIIRIANFYLQEGTNINTDTYTFRIVSSPDKPLNNDALIELQNIEGIASISPYFSPTNQAEGSIDYFGFKAKYPITLKGIPNSIGKNKSNPDYQKYWDSIDLRIIPILLPQQAFSLYNSLAPQKDWPILNEDAFLGLPNVYLTIEGTKYRAIITGFDKDEFGIIASVPAQKLFTLYQQQNLNPLYDHIIITTISGITKKQARNTSKSISLLNYKLESANEENFKTGLFIRIKITVTILGTSIIIAFILLKIYHLYYFFSLSRRKIWLHRVWGIRDYTGLQTFLFSVMFTGLCGFISWAVCFFAIIPAQDYLIQVLTQLGFNSPPIKDSAKTALETGIIGAGVFEAIVILTYCIFSFSIPKANHIKKF